MRAKVGLLRDEASRMRQHPIALAAIEALSVGGRTLIAATTVHPNINVKLTRRALLSQTTMAALTAAVAPSHVLADSGPKQIKAVAFDAFPIFDPRPIFKSCERFFPERGAELAQLWRTRQFEYQWLRALSGQYVDFWNATRDALVFAASSLELAMNNEQCDLLMNGYLQLKAWPDVKPALQSIRMQGLKLAFLSNATLSILERGIANSGLDHTFDAVISTDRVRSFKPDPRAYQLGVETLGLRKHEILFVAFAGWDVAGAKWFGYPTFWNNRQSAVAEALGVAPDASGMTLDTLVEYLRQR